MPYITLTVNPLGDHESNSTTYVTAAAGIVTALARYDKNKNRPVGYTKCSFMEASVSKLIADGTALSSIKTSCRTGSRASKDEGAIATIAVTNRPPSTALSTREEKMTPANSR